MTGTARLHRIGSSSLRLVRNQPPVRLLSSVETVSLLMKSLGLTELLSTSNSQRSIHTAGSMSSISKILMQS
jgi:hypothetical protein